MGWALGIGRIGAVAGPAIGGIMLALHWRLPTPYMISAVPELIAVVATAALLRLERRKAGAHAALASSV